MLIKLLHNCLMIFKEHQCRGDFCFRILLQFTYVVFLALFSYVILVRQEKIPSNIVEIVIIIFVCTLLTEEIRQVKCNIFSNQSF